MVFWDTYETPYKNIIKKKWVNLIIKDKDKTKLIVIVIVIILLILMILIIILKSLKK